MKKILAAVLAVAMAASMSAVAFAKDYQYDSGKDDWATIIAGAKGDENGSATIAMGKEKSFRVMAGQTEQTPEFKTEELAKLMDDGYLSADVIVTSGKANLASNPTLKSINDEAVMKIKFKDTWGVDDKDVKLKTRFTAKKDIADPNDPSLYILSFVNENNELYYVNAKALDADGDLTNTAWNENNFYIPAENHNENDFAWLTADQVKEAKNIIKKNNKVETSSKGIKKEEKVHSGTVMMKKGDTITSTEFKVTGTYYDVTSYDDSITITPTEVSDRYVVANGEDLYDASNGDNKIIIYFGATGDVASLEFKVSSAQKDLNLGYNNDEIEEITAAYPEYDFEFLRFNTYQNANANVLTNTGTMTFNAIGGKQTRVYEWDGKTLTEKNVKYNSYDETVTVDGIKRLTCYVVADGQLEAKVEETDPPATETEPVTEPVAPPTAEPVAPDNNQNPPTGAL